MILWSVVGRLDVQDVVAIGTESLRRRKIHGILPSDQACPTTQEDQQEKWFDVFHTEKGFGFRLSIAGQVLEWEKSERYLMITNGRSVSYVKKNGSIDYLQPWSLLYFCMSFFFSRTSFMMLWRSMISVMSS